MVRWCLAIDQTSRSSKKICVSISSIAVGVRRGPASLVQYYLRMVIAQTCLSPELRSELHSASILHQFVMETFPNIFTVTNDRLNMLAAKTHLADDLYGSIIYLLSAGGPYDGGAFALIRPLVEVSVEAQWQFSCARDETFRRAYAGDDVDPGLPNMMDQLDRYIGTPVFAALKEKIGTLHGFTHGGIEQLGRRFDAEGNLSANYSDKEKVEVIRACTAIFELLSSIFCQAASSSPARDDPRSISIEAKYAELYGTDV